MIDVSLFIYPVGFHLPMKVFLIRSEGFSLIIETNMMRLPFANRQRIYQLIFGRHLNVIGLNPQCILVRITNFICKSILL